MFIVSGSATLFLVACGAGYWWSTNSGAPRKAVKPWDEASGPKADWRLFVLANALLAPNPHNLQPWLAELLPDGSIVLKWNTKKSLPETDPPGRQIIVGFGCFIEAAVIAASAIGKSLDVNLFPTGFPSNTSLSDLAEKPIAVLIGSDAKSEPDALYSQLVKRHCVKKQYEMNKPVDASSILALQNAGTSPRIQCKSETRAKQVDAIRKVCLSAVTLENELPAKKGESVKWMRFGRNEVDANPDGIALYGPPIEALILAGEMNSEKMMRPDSMISKLGLKSQLDTIHATPSFFWIESLDNSRVSQIDAGRAFLRATLAATKLGLSTHPCSAPLQEYPEMSSLYLQIHKLLGVNSPSRIQMLVRLGYGPAAYPAPRWEVSSFVKMIN